MNYNENNENNVNNVEDLNHEEQQENVYVVGGLELNTETKEFLVDGEQVKLTPIEFKIITLLMTHAGRVISAEDSGVKVWVIPANEELGIARRTYEYR